MSTLPSPNDRGPDEVLRNARNNYVDSLRGFMDQSNYTRIDDFDQLSDAASGYVDAFGDYISGPVATDNNEVPTGHLTLFEINTLRNEANKLPTTHAAVEPQTDYILAAMSVAYAGMWYVGGEYGRIGASGLVAASFIISGLKKRKLVEKNLDPFEVEDTPLTIETALEFLDSPEQTPEACVSLLEAATQTDLLKASTAANVVLRARTYTIFGSFRHFIRQKRTKK